VFGLDIFYCLSYAVMNSWTLTDVPCDIRGAVGVVGWGTALQDGKSRVRFPMGSLGFFVLNNSCGRTMPLGSTQPVTEIFPGGQRLPVRRADNLTTLICRLSGSLNILEPSGLVQACKRIIFTSVRHPLPSLWGVTKTVEIQHNKID